MIDIDSEILVFEDFVSTVANHLVPHQYDDAFQVGMLTVCEHIWEPSEVIRYKVIHAIKAYRRAESTYAAFHKSNCTPSLRMVPRGIRPKILNQSRATPAAAN